MAEVAANTVICLINQASHLLWRRIQRLEQQFVEEGGFAERLYRVRSEQLRRERLKDQSDQSDQSDRSALSGFFGSGMI